MDSLFKVDLEKMTINISSRDHTGNKNTIISLDQKPDNEFSLINQNKKISRRSIKLLFNRTEKSLLKAIDYIITNDYQKAEKILCKIKKNDKRFPECCYLLSLLKGDYFYKTSLLNNLFNDLNGYGEFFNRYSLEIELIIPLNEKLCIILNNSKEGIAILLGLHYYVNNDPEKAEMILNNVRKDDTPLVGLLLGEIYLSTGQYDKTIQLLQNTNSNQIISLYSSLIVGKAFREMGLLKTSINILRKTRRAAEQFSLSLHLEGRYQLALSLEKSNKMHLAFREYEKILALNYEYRDIKNLIEDLR